MLIHDIAIADLPVSCTGLPAGELYMATSSAVLNDEARWFLLTAKTVVIGRLGCIDFIVPEENAYCFDACNCYKVLNVS